jgi:uncharacterized protein
MGRVIHFEIHCGDLDRAEAFYTGIFGWQIQRIGGPMDYRLCTTGPDGEPGINGALLQRQGEIDGEAVVAYVCTVQTDDLGQVEQRVPQSGGTQVMDRMEIPEVGQLAYFKDPEGNIFGVLQPYGEGNVD